MFYKEERHFIYYMVHIINSKGKAVTNNKIILISFKQKIKRIVHVFSCNT